MNKKLPLINDPRLTAYVLGELNETESAEIQQAIEQSAELQAEIKQIRAVCQLLDNEFATVDNEHQLTSEQREQIAGAIANTEMDDEKVSVAAKQQSKQTASTNRHFASRFRWAIAVCVMLLIGIPAALVLFGNAGPFFQVAHNADMKKENDSSWALESPVKSKSKSEPEVFDEVFDDSSSIGDGKRAASGYFSERESSVMPNPAKPSLLEIQLNTSPQVRLNKFDEGGGGFRGFGGGGFGGGKFNEFGGDFSKSPSSGDFAIELKPSAISGRTGEPATGNDGKKTLVFPDSEEWQRYKSLRAKYSNIRLLDNANDEAWIAKGLAEKVLVKDLVWLDKSQRDWFEKSGGNKGLDGQALGQALEKARKKQRVEILAQLREINKERQAVVDKLGAGRHKSVEDLDLRIKFLNHFLTKTIDAKPKSWKRVKAVPNTSRLMIGDKEELGITGMQVNVQIDGFRARVVIDYFFYNDRDQQLEGSFKLRLPNDASPYYFAFGQSRFDFTPDARDLDTRMEREFVRPADGTRFVSLEPGSIRDLRKGAWDDVKEARMVPKQKAAFAYQQTTKRRIDPALVEWAGAGVFNAKVFPLAPKKLHRVVVGYDVNLTQVDDRWVYQLALPEQAGDCQIDVRVASTDQVEVSPAVELDKFDETANFHLDNPTQKAYSVSIPAERGIVLTRTVDDDLSVFATRVQLPLKSKSQTSSKHAVFLVDTSLSSRPEKFNLWLKMLTRLLKDNRDSLKRFNVVFFNVESYWWKPSFVDNTEKNVDLLMNHCNTLVLEGATDLYSAIRLATTTSWSAADADARPDLFLLSDGAATWGETNLQLIARLLDRKSVGSMFAYQAGMSGTSIRALQFLTAKTGGAVFSVIGEDETKKAARAHRNQPWRLVDISATGASDVMTAGRVQWVYPGQSMMVVGRGAPKGELVFKLENNDREQTLKIPVAKKHETELAVRAYGQVSVGQLENLGDVVNDFSTAYARHFRVTGQTCSLLMLDSEADYKRFNIKPENDQFVVTSKPCSKVIDNELSKNAAAMADPKAMLKMWLEQLESAPQINFKIPTALRLAIEKVQVPVVSGKLNCQWRSSDQYSAEFLKMLEGQKLTYDKLVAEAKKRRAEASEDDAIKVLSNLIEQNPGNLQLIRDVAMMAMEFDRPEQAYPLLKTVAFARPFNAVVYTALARCLTEMGNVDLAMVFFEIAVTGTFDKASFRQIATTQYIGLLKQIERGEHQTQLKGYATSRLKSLVNNATNKNNMIVDKADILITMMWNTDRSDVDLHVIDSAGEECYYQHNRTKMGGRITSDVTDGYGPEMFWLPRAKPGRYQVKINYFGSDNLRTNMRSKVHVTVYRNFGTTEQTMTRKTISLGRAKEKRTVMEFRVK